jgi:hypothetical protein
MRRFLLPGVATVVLYAALTGCVSDLSRGIAFCQETYFGYARATCEQRIIQKYGHDNRGPER